MIKKYDGNIKTYLYYSLIGNLIILGPIIMIYLQEKGLNFSQIMILNSIGSITVFLFEVPTGSIADKISRKVSLIIGSLLWSVQLIIIIYANNFYMFALSQILMSLGITFKSGADTALLYDSLKTMGREGEIQKFQGKANSFMFYGQAVGSILAGFLYKFNIYFPFIFSVLTTTISAIIAMKFIEPPIDNKKTIKEESYYKHIFESSKYVLNHEKVKAVVLYGSVFYIFYRAGFYFFSPYFEAVHIDVQYFGILFAMFNIIAGLISQNSHKIVKRTKSKTLTLLSSTIILSFTLLGLTRIWIGSFAILLQQVARGLYSPVITKYLNKHIPSNKRATIISLYSLIVSLAAALCYPLFGLLADNYNIFKTHLVMAIAMLITTYISLRYYGKNSERFRKSKLSENI